jgi:hypothetical protein
MTKGELIAALASCALSHNFDETLMLSSVCTRYTSLGSTYNTHPNPYLADPEMEKGFAPAWMLEDGSQERAGREVTNHTQQTETEAEIGGEAAVADTSGENAQAADSTAGGGE